MALLSRAEGRAYRVAMATTVAFETFNLSPDPTQLNTFQRLPEEERLKVIIRVLCGLVAMEEQPERPSPESLRPNLGVTRTRRFRLPFLGLETGGEQKWATMSGGAR